MIELYSFLFSLGLGIVARPLYIGASYLAKRTGLFPVTIAIDFALAALIGGALTAFIIATGAVIAPYVFAALAGGYFIAYSVTRKRDGKKPAEKKSEKQAAEKK